MRPPLNDGMASRHRSHGYALTMDQHKEFLTHPRSFNRVDKTQPTTSGSSNSCPMVSLFRTTCHVASISKWEYIYIYKADTYTCIYYIFQITISIHPVHPKPYLCEYTSLAEIIVYNIYIWYNVCGYDYYLLHPFAILIAANDGKYTAIPYLDGMEMVGW